MKPTFMRLRIAAVIPLLLLLCAQAFGWGDEGHLAINRAAAQKSPATMPAFLRTKTAVARLEYLGPDPDRWRHAEEFAVKNSQEPDHFINLERVNLEFFEYAELPRGRYQFYQLLYDRRSAMLHREANVGYVPRLGLPPLQPDDLLPERVGLQPYITMEIYDRLKVAFREYRRLRSEKKPLELVEGNIIYYMGLMGHYVGDGSNPLHTTVRYNGWVGENPNNYAGKGIHWRMEGAFVGRNIQKLPLNGMVKAPTALTDPWQDYQKYLRTSYTLVEKVYRLDKAAGFESGGTPESREFIRQRLAAGAQELVDLWYTAWLESEKLPAEPKYD